MLEIVRGICVCAPVFVCLWLWIVQKSQNLFRNEEKVLISLFCVWVEVLFVFASHSLWRLTKSHKLAGHTHTHSQWESGKHGPAFGWCYQEAFGGWLFPHVAPVLPASGNKNNLQVCFVPAAHLHLCSVICRPPFPLSLLLTHSPLRPTWSNLPPFQVFFLLSALCVVMSLEFKWMEMFCWKRLLWIYEASFVCHMKAAHSWRKKLRNKQFRVRN